MRCSTSNVLALAVCLALGTPALGSIQGTYSGNFVTGVSGAAYSYIHEATKVPKTGDANYAQYAGGKVLYAIDSAPAANIGFMFNDVSGDGLSNGDSLTFNNLSVGILVHDGSFDTTNTGAAAGTLTLDGTLTIGGGFSDNAPTNFTHGVYNVLENSPVSLTGLVYTINDTPGNGGGVLNSGEIFFQSGELAGPFNGIKYDAGSKKLTFAIWGNSLDNLGGESGVDANGSAAPLGFDIFVEATLIPGPDPNQTVPEATSLVIWSLLTCSGLLVGRRSAAVCC
jgi:hypothetical protein